MMWWYMCSLHVPTLHCSTCHGQCTCPCPRVNVCPAQLHVPPDQERRCHSQQFYQNWTNIELTLPDFFCKIDISALFGVESKVKFIHGLPVRIRSHICCRRIANNFAILDFEIWAVFKFQTFSIFGCFIINNSNIFYIHSTIWKRRFILFSKIWSIALSFPWNFSSHLSDRLCDRLKFSPQFQNLHQYQYSCCKASLLHFS